MEKTKKPWLIVMCGLSGSGKSTLAKKIADKRDAEIISSDELRKEMFGDETHQEDKNKLFTEYNKRIRAALERGSDAISDKTNLLCEETVIEASLMMLNGAYCSIGIKELEEYDFKKREKKLYRVSQT